MAARELRIARRIESDWRRVNAGRRDEKSGDGNPRPDANGVVSSMNRVTKADVQARFPREASVARQAIDRAPRTRLETSARETFVRSCL